MSGNNNDAPFTLTPKDRSLEDHRPAGRRLRRPEPPQVAMSPSETQRAREVMTVSEAGALLGLGRTGSYDAVRRGEIPVIRLGRNIVVSVARMEALLGLEGGRRLC
jgi:excisionase family DNA binding protein